MIVTIDIGGTKTLVAGFNHKGEPVHERRFPTPKDSDKFLAELIELLDDLYKPIDIDAISIAVPGFIEDDIVKWCGNLPWRDLDLVRPLKKLFNAPIFVENDANLAGLAEASALKPVPKLCLYVTVSTGIGSGIVADGKILSQLSGSEIGHMALEYDGKLQQWESFASGSAIHKLYGKFGYEIESKRDWNDIAKRISRGFVAIIPLLQPQVIVIGGSIGTHFSRFRGQLEEHIDKTLPPFLVRPKIVQAKHPQEAVIYGCYYQAVQRLAN